MSGTGDGPGLKNLKFVVIENHPQSIIIVRRILHALGARDIQEGGNGGEGLALIREHRPDIVVTDWAMDPMDGCEMVREIRKDKDDRVKFVPVIMLTGFSERHRIIHARDSGINEYLLKPISAQTLYSRIRAVIEQPRRFVRTASYFGPDRRRTDGDFEGPDRRGNDSPLEAKARMKQQLTQKEIEDEYFMPTASGSTASAEQYIPPGIRRARELAKKNTR